MTENTIPLNKLVTWTGNVRKTAKHDGIDELAASIAAHGLLQSLVVRKTSRGRFAVVAGERRRQAMARLAEAGQLEADHPVSCRIVDAEADATEISLTENVMRMAMHPADQFEAFRTLIDAGAPAADVAVRFGTSEITVTRRMKLGRVSPALLDLYRDGKMGLEQVQAFAISDDHAAQERVWSEIGAYYNQSPHQIRQMLTTGEIPASDKRARFVTVEAYEAAGGTVRRDLFDDRGSGYIVDVALLDQLVTGKLTEAQDAIAAEGWKWIEIRTEFDWQERERFRQLEAEPVPLSAEDSDESNRLEDELSDLTDADDLSPEGEARVAEIEARLSTLSERLEEYSDEQRAASGIVISLHHDGTLRFDRGLVRPEDRLSDGNDGDPDDETASVTARPAGLAASLVDDLTQHRTAIVQAELAGNPHVALAAVVHAMTLRAFYRYDHAASCLSIITSPPSTKAARDSRASDALQSDRDRWNDDLPGKAGDLWKWCLEQEDHRLVELLAACAASSVNFIQAKNDNPSDARLTHGQQLAQALDIDMAEWFQPTAANYFSRIDKASILKAIAEARQQPNEPAWAKLKKADLAALGERYAAGTAWLPEPLRIEPSNSDGDMVDELFRSAA